MKIINIPSGNDVYDIEVKLLKIIDEKFLELNINLYQKLYGKPFSNIWDKCERQYVINEDYQKMDINTRKYLFKEFWKMYNKVTQPNYENIN